MTREWKPLVNPARCGSGRRDRLKGRGRVGSDEKAPVVPGDKELVLAPEVRVRGAARESRFLLRNLLDRRSIEAGPDEDLLAASIDLARVNSRLSSRVAPQAF